MGDNVKSVFLSDHAPVVFVTYVVKYSYEIPLTIDLTSTWVITQTVFALAEQALHHSSEDQNPSAKHKGSLAAPNLSGGKHCWGNFGKRRHTQLKTPSQTTLGGHGGCGAGIC